MSSPVVEFRAIQPGDVEHIAQHLRDQDAAELRANGERDALAALRRSVEESAVVVVATAHGEPGCMFGCVPGGTLLAPSAVVWMVGTHLVPQHQRVLARLAPRYILAMHARFGRLYNAVHASNTLAVRWLKRMGFVLHEPHPNPVTGEMFHYFEMSN